MTSKLKQKIEVKKENKTNIQSPQDLAMKGKKEEKAKMEYDPKLCKQKRLTGLFPKLEIRNLIDEIHPHLLHFYKLSKRYLTFYESQTSISPLNLKSPYSDSSNQVGKLNYSTLFKGSNDELMKVELFENENKQKYVLKTFWTKFNISDSSQNSCDSIQDFLSNRYNEYELIKIFSTCPHSVQPIDFHIVYCPNSSILITELLLTYGGAPISNFFPKTNESDIYDIFLQMSIALNFLECLKIAQNDIKAGNILIDFSLDFPVIKFIDFDIGKNQSSTVKDTKTAHPSGYTNFYVAPEILKYAKDPEKNSSSSSPWKCQIYSMGILMLQLVGFFEKQMYIKEIDKLKESEKGYEGFLKKFTEYSSSVTNPLMKNILFLIKICVSYHSDDRLSAGELLTLLEDLEKKDLNIISDQYKNAIQKRSQNTTIKLENYRYGDLGFTSSIKENNVYSDDQSIKFNKRFYNDTTALINEIEVKNKIINHQNEMITSLSKKIEEIETSNSKLGPLFRDNISSSQGSKNPEDKKKDQLIKYLNEKLNLSDKMKEATKIQIHNLEETLRLNEEKFQFLSTHVNSKIQEQEEMLQKIDACFQNIKSKIQNENKIILNSVNDYTELLDWLYSQCFNLSKLAPNSNSTYSENIILEQGVMYSGPFKDTKIPHGVGALIYDNPPRKLIGEFENGSLKNSMGMMIDVNNNYLFGPFENGICKNPSFIYENLHNNKLNGYYFGETVLNIIEGKGKYIEPNGSYYEGEFKNWKKEGNGKCNYPNGNLYEGNWANNLREGLGKLTFINERYYEGIFKKDKMEGEGKLCDPDGSYYEGEFKNDLKEGKGKYYILFGDDEASMTLEGSWKNNKREGKFIVSNTNSEPYYVEYEDDVKIKEYK